MTKSIFKPFSQVIFLIFLHTVLVQPLLYSNNKTIKFEHITPEQGLSQNTVLSILQDDLGFMWLATQDGLNKFDGYRFTVYKNDPEDPNSISNNDVWRLSLDPNEPGVLWVGTYGGGLNKFNRKRNKFTRYQHDPKNSGSLTDNDILAIYHDNDGTMWIGTLGGGFSRFDNEQQSFTHYKHVPHNQSSLNNNFVEAIYQDRDEREIYWIGTGAGGLNRFDSKNQLFKHYRHEPKRAASLSSDYVRIILGDPEDSNILWIATGDGGLNRLDIQMEEFTRFQHEAANPLSLSNNHIWSICFDASGSLWVGTQFGLNKFDRKNERFILFEHDPLDKGSISGNSIRSMYESDSGVLWIGTQANGINKYDPSKLKFETFTMASGRSSSLTHPDVTAIHQDQSDNLWIGTRGGGLNVIQSSLTEGSYTIRHVSEAKVLHLQHDPGDRESLGGDEIFSIFEDHSGTLWFGTEFGGLSKLISPRPGSLPATSGKSSTRFKQYKYEPGNLTDNQVRAIYEAPDEPGLLWLGTFGGGLSCFDPQTESFTGYINDPADPRSLSHDNVWSIHQSLSESDVLWIGTQGGLNKFNRKTGDFKRYQSLSDISSALSSNMVVDIYESPSKPRVLWVATYGGGLNRFDVQSEEFRHYRQKDGLSNDAVLGILEDRHGNLWISTVQGISQFNPATGEFRNYDVNDGLQDNEFNSGAIHQNSTGEMYFGGVNGFNRFYPGDIKDNKHIPPIVFTDFQIFNERVRIRNDETGAMHNEDTYFLPKHISEIDTLELSYRQNVFSFEIAALDYAAPEKNQYAYKMEGFDEEWNYPGSRRFVTYTNLAPGEYDFRAKGSNNDGIWNETGTSMHIVITPPFWQTWWFISLLGSAVLVLIYLAHYQSILKERKKAELNKNIANLKLMALNAQMKPHFIFNTINSIQYFISGNDQIAANEYLSKFAKLLRMTLENSDTSTIPLSRELECLTLYLELESLRFEDRFVYKIDVDPGIDLEMMEIPVMLIQPYVENAIQHGLLPGTNQGEIHISLNLENDMLICTLRDNGIGIEAARKSNSKNTISHTPTAMKVTRERLLILNHSSVAIEPVEVIDLGSSRDGESGTLVKIRVPLKVNGIQNELWKFR